jgi:hypothetical protein
MLQSCYTIIDYKKIDETLQRKKIGFPADAQIDQALAGNWFSRHINWMDGPTEMERLTFSTDGKIELNKNVMSYSSPIYYGEFRVMLDTLIINFVDKYSSERYLYELSNDTLFLTRADMTSKNYYIYSPGIREKLTK